MTGEGTGLSHAVEGEIDLADAHETVRFAAAMHH
jgi:hypothetical protein